MTHHLNDIIKQLNSDSSSIRLKAIQALGQYDDIESILPILEELLADESVAVVRAATITLGRIGACEHLAVIVPLLAHDSLWIRKASVQAIGLLGCQEAAPLLVRLLEDDALHALSREALVALKVDPDFF